MRKSRILLVNDNCVGSKFQAKGLFLTHTAQKTKFPINSFNDRSPYHIENQN